MLKEFEQRVIITSFDVKDAAVRGDTRLLCPAGAIVSAEARDEAGRLGVTIETEIEHAVSPEVPTQSVQTQGVSSQVTEEVFENVEIRTRADAVVTGGRVAIPGHGLLDADVLVGSGRVLALGKGFSCDGQLIDASGLLVMPGAFDPHVHLGLFGSLDEELESEGTSALIGGVTTLGWFVGGGGSHLERIEGSLISVPSRSPVDIVPHLVIGEDIHLKEIPQYVTRGVRSFKVYMCGLPGLIEHVEDGFFMDVLKALSPFKDRVVLCIHAENPSLVERASKELDDSQAEWEGLDTWAHTHPDLAEVEAVRRASLLSRESGVKIYFVHISSGAGVEALKQARAEDQRDRIVGETTSPYLMSPPKGSDEPLGKMVPPLRGEKTVEELWRGVDEGIIDTIGTDNVTMTKQEKKVEGAWKNVVPGYPALGTHLPALFHEGYHRRGIELMTIISAVTRKPAEVYGLYPRKGTLLPGSDADLAVIDLQKTQTVRPEQLGSRSDFALAEGRELKGWPVMTMKRGKIAVLFGQIRESVKGELILNT